MDRYTPRHPTAQEVAELNQYYSELQNERVDDLGDIGYIAVFDHYITDCPGYAGRMMMVVWPGSPSMYEVFTWNAEGQIRKQPNEYLYCDRKTEGRVPVWMDEVELAAMAEHVQNDIEENAVLGEDNEVVRRAKQLLGRLQIAQRILNPTPDMFGTNPMPEG
jgi:hypothetical protein